MDLEFVGRERELALVRDLVAQAGSGRGGLVLVRGELGIGKTTLLGRIEQYGRDAGFDVHSATCWEDSAPPCWPWTQLVRSVSADASGPVLEETRQALDLLVPRVGGPTTGRPTVDDSVRSGAASFAL